MILVVRHLTAFRYPGGAAGVALRLKLFPQSFEGQRVICFPARDVVVVRLGKMGPDDAPALNAHLAAIAACFPTH